ncbi:MAG TPA: histidine phosphatase family protein [Gammaproteobacteria bacterium]|nr:histidine phosphatase family protein [Gammaproteobacteria bacterium]
MIKLLAKFLIVSLLCLSQQAFANNEKLIFAVDVIRHGDRTPVANPPNVPYQWKLGLGQLTPKGMQQEFQLGSKLRKRYIEDEKLLPASYDADTLYVRSSDFDHTLMSADCFLYGLYPSGTGPSALPSSYQPIPIHTMPLFQDHLLVPDHNRKKYAELLKKYVFTKSEWQKKEAEVKPHLNEWGKLLGVKINGLYDLTVYADRLFIQELYGEPLPNGMTLATAEEIINKGKWAFLYIYKQPEVGGIKAKPLLYVILTYLKKAQEKKTKLKYILFSAHDSTLMSMMTLLQNPLDTHPHYASDLNLALYEIDNNYVVRIKFNDEAVSIPLCKKAECQIKELEKLVKPDATTLAAMANIPQ